MVKKTCENCILSKNKQWLHELGHTFTKRLYIKIILGYLRIPLYLVETVQAFPRQITKRFVLEVVNNYDTTFIQVVNNTLMRAIHGILHSLVY